MISRFRNEKYHTVGTFAVEDEDDDFAPSASGGGFDEISEAPPTTSLVDDGIERATFMLKRGPYGIGFGFTAAKESLVEMKLQGWAGTHLLDLLSFADGGLFIASVADDSPAKEAGMLRFDVIQKVNGQDVRNWTQAEIVTMIKSTEEVLVLEVVRHRDSALKEAQVQWDHVKDPLHKIRSKLMTLFNVST